MFMFIPMQSSISRRAWFVQDGPEVLGTVFEISIPEYAPSPLYYAVWRSDDSHVCRTSFSAVTEWFAKLDDIRLATMEQEGTEEADRWIRLQSTPKD